MGSWGVSDFFSVDDDFSPSSSTRIGVTTSTTTTSSQRSGAASSQTRLLQPDSNSQTVFDDGGHESFKRNVKNTDYNNVKNPERTVVAASSRGVKRKQTAGVATQLSQETHRKTTTSSTISSSSFARKSSFTKNPSFDNSSSSISSSSSSSSSRSEIWSDRHSPVSADQLAVHPKKVQEVRQWLESYYSQEAGQSRVVSPFLLLTGPSGKIGEWHEWGGKCWGRRI